MTRSAWYVIIAHQYLYHLSCILLTHLLIFSSSQQMESRLSDGQAAAASSASQKSLNVAKPQRGRYERPTHPRHLNDKAERGSLKQTLVQFARHSHSITPPPDTDTTGWAPAEQALLVTRTSVDPPPTKSGPRKDRNMVSAAAQHTTKTQLSVHIANGGKPAVEEIMAQMLATGQFDDMAFAYVDARRSGGRADPNIKLTSITNGEDIPAFIALEEKARAIAEKNQTIQDLAANPDSGITTETYNSFDDLESSIMNIV